jgi:NhaP-type Na+/H+ or K+/H+ antiporter
MFARLTAKAIWAAVAIAMAFFGIGFLGMAAALALTAALGTVNAYAVVGAVLLAPPLLWAIFIRGSKKQPPPPNNELTRVLLAAVAKETPWLAIIGAGLASVASMFLNRNKSSK